MTRSETSPIRPLTEQEQARVRDLYLTTSKSLAGSFYQCGRWTGDELENLVQECFRVFCEELSKGTSIGNDQACIFGISRNVARDYLKKKIKNRAQTTEFTSEEDLPDKQSICLETSLAMVECLDRVFQALDVDQQAAFELMLNGNTYSEISTKLQIPIGTINDWVPKILALIRKEYGRGSPQGSSL